MSILTLSPTTTRKVLAAIVAFLLVSLAIVRTSDAAFTAEHTNPDNQFATGQIDLDSAVEVPLFGTGAPDSLAEATTLKPGDVVDACIDIEYTGTYDAADLDEVQLTVNGADAGTLADDLSVTVALYTQCGGAFESSVVTDDLSALSDVATGWEPNDGESRGFHFTVTVGDGVDQDDSLTDVGFVWSLQTSS